MPFRGFPPGLCELILGFLAEQPHFQQLAQPVVHRSGHAGVRVNANEVWFFGGHPCGRRGQTTDFSIVYDRVETRISRLALDSMQWSTVQPIVCSSHRRQRRRQEERLIRSAYRVGGTAYFDEHRKRVLIVGGMSLDHGKWIYATTIHAFNTATASWSVVPGVELPASQDAPCVFFGRTARPTDK
jgi:hypothetical protein